MAKPFSMFLRLLLLTCASVAVFFSIGASGLPQVPALFAFGDSIIDDGNNNYLNSIAKANYLPYGIDFDGGPSGRFCNGKTIIDFLGSGLSVLSALYLSIFSFKSITTHARTSYVSRRPCSVGELLGLPYVPAYVNTLEDDQSILRGVNYASAAAGILDESGRQLVHSFFPYLSVSFRYSFMWIERKLMK